MPGRIEGALIQIITAGGEYIIDIKKKAGCFVFQKLVFQGGIHPAYWQVITRGITTYRSTPSATVALTNCSA